MYIGDSSSLLEYPKIVVFITLSLKIQINLSEIFCKSVLLLFLSFKIIILRFLKIALTKNLLFTPLPPNIGLERVKALSQEELGSKNIFFI